MKTLSLITIVILCSAIAAGCGSKDPDPARPSATRAAGKVQAGMKLKDVEKAMGGPGSVDAADPNSLHFPTEDGDVKVTLADGVVTQVTTVGDR